MMLCDLDTLHEKRAFVTVYLASYCSCFFVVHLCPVDAMLFDFGKTADGQDVSLGSFLMKSVVIHTAFTGTDSI